APVRHAAPVQPVRDLGGDSRGLRRGAGRRRRRRGSRPDHGCRGAGAQDARPVRRTGPVRLVDRRRRGRPSRAGRQPQLPYGAHRWAGFFPARRPHRARARGAVPVKRRTLDERGQAAGFEVLPFGLLVLVLGTLLVANAWEVIDAKIAVTASAREAARVFVEAPTEREGA